MTDINLLPTPGQLIADRYEVTDMVGRGGGGVVYRALQVGTGRDVALKVLPPEHQLHATAVRRFEREARLVSRLSHPNTVTVYELIRTPSSLLCIAMEFVEGVQLKSVLERAGRIPPGRAVPILRQICKSLAEAHAAGIVHRDLKPANIMLCNMHTERDFVKVLDFGVATALDDDSGYADDMTQTADVVGTPKYMAPEQFRSGPISPASDLYSLGCIAFEMLSGYSPFDGETLHVTIAKHLFQPPPTLPGFLDVYPSLVALVHQLLSKAPGDRLQTAEAVLDALEYWEEGSDATVVGIPAMLDDDLVPYDEMRVAPHQIHDPRDQTDPGLNVAPGTTFPPGYSSSATPSHIPTPNPQQTPHGLILPDASMASMEVAARERTKWIVVGVVGFLTLVAFVVFLVVRFGGDDASEEAESEPDEEIAASPIDPATDPTPADPLPQLGSDLAEDIERTSMLELAASRIGRGANTAAVEGAIRTADHANDARADEADAPDPAATNTEAAGTEATPKRRRDTPKLDASGNLSFVVKYDPPMAAVTVEGAKRDKCSGGRCSITAAPGTKVSLALRSMGYKPTTKAIKVSTGMRRTTRVNLEPMR